MQDEPNTRPTIMNGKAISSRLLIALLLAVFFLKSVVECSLRLFAEEARLLFLLVDGLVATVTFGVTAVYFLRGARNTRLSLGAWGIILFLVLQLAIFRAFSGPEIGVLGLDPWTTYSDEIARGSVILLLYGLFCSWRPEHTPKAMKIARRAAITYIAVMLALLIYAVLQHLELLPVQYFQWVFGIHVPRPSGGFTHPHFYAVLNALAIPAILHLLRSHTISQTTSIALGFLMLFGSLVSTSRVGVIVTAANLLLLFYYSGALRNTSAYIGGGIIAFATAAYAASNMAYIAEYIDVFFSFLSRGGDILRGRTENWGMELSVINYDAQTLFFGYGYQPLVSHNMILRLLQVHGAVGTLLYIIFFLIVLLKASRGVTQQGRAFIHLALLPIIVGSITVPFLVSVPLNAAVVLILSISTISYGANRRALLQATTSKQHFAKPALLRRSTI